MAFLKAPRTLVKTAVVAVLLAGCGNAANTAPISGFYTFSATKTVAGLAGASDYDIEGNYKRRTGKATVTKQEPRE